MPRRPQIYVDADACPVKSEVVRVAERHGLTAIFVANRGLRPSKDPQIRNVVVSSGPDAADDWIVENIAKHDIAVTADIPLAHRVVERDGWIVKPEGTIFSRDNIGMAVAVRDLKHQLRESGNLTTHNPSFTPRDRSKFLGALDTTVRRSLNASKKDS